LSDTESARIASEPGAPRQGTTIPLSAPVLRGNEWAYVKECLDTNWVSSAGPFVDRFEKMAADRVGVRHAVAVVNGTAALHLALLVAGVERDDEVVMPALTFIAPANAARYLGAWPVFIDVDPDYWQIDPQRFADFIEGDCEWRNGSLRNRRTGRRVKAVVPVDILGHPCDLDPIAELARARGLVVVEDATEGLGALYKGRPVGQRADVSCLSFNGNKIVTSGGGGMIATDRSEWAERARYLSTQAKDDPVEYVHGSVGYNYRLTNIQAALGVAQLEQLDEYVAAKRRHADRYSDALRQTEGISPMAEARWAASTFWLYTVLVDAVQYGADSRSLLGRLARNGIQSRPLWQPLNRSPALAGCPSASTPVADRIAASALSLPSSVDLTYADQDRVVATVTKSA
jgi:perosamine synthetase